MSTTDDFLFDGPVAESTHPFEETYGAYESTHQFNSQPPIYAEFSNGDEVFGGSNGPVLPPPSDMAAEEGFALREWSRENAIRLEEKEKKEKEMLSRIIDEAEEYKLEFYRKREVKCEMNKVTNREREKVLFANHEKFHAEADKDYWKAIAELIPKEVPTIEKKRLKKDQETQPGIVMIQGPKPGKPTDLSRMRQLVINLKHSTPTHLKLSPTAAPAAKDSKTGDVAVAAAPVNAATAVGAAPEAVAISVA